MKNFYVGLLSYYLALYILFDTKQHELAYGYELRKKSCWIGSWIAKKLQIWKRDWWEEDCLNGSGIDEKFCWNGSGIGQKNIAEIEADLIKRILLKWKRDCW